MGLFRKSSNEAVTTYREAKSKLRDEYRNILATPDREETEAWREANDAVAEAEKNVSWWRR